MTFKKTQSIQGPDGFFNTNRSLSLLQLLQRRPLNTPITAPDTKQREKLQLVTIKNDVHAQRGSRVTTTDPLMTHHIQNRALIVDYKNCALLQRYIGLGGKILPRRQTMLSAKQQRYVAKTIKSARIMGILPFVRKEQRF